MNRQGGKAGEAAAEESEPEPEVLETKQVGAQVLRVRPYFA